MIGRLPPDANREVLDWRAFLSRFDLGGMKGLLDEALCPFHGEDDLFSSSRLIDALGKRDLSDRVVVHTIWYCLGCGACTAGAEKAAMSFAALALQARRLLLARGEEMPSLFRGALAALGRLADATGGLRPLRLLPSVARAWPEGDILFWTGRMGLAAALFDGPEAARVSHALTRSYGVLEEAGLHPAVLDPEPCLDFESAWFGDRQAFLRRVELVAERFAGLGTVKVVAADPLSAMMLEWVASERGLPLSVEPFSETWARVLVSQQETAARGYEHQPAGRVAILPEPRVNLSFLADDPVLDTWSPPSQAGLVRALGYEPVVLAQQESAERPGMVSVGLRSLAMVSARSAALCRELLREADQLQARKVLVADPMSWAALADVSRTGTWRRAQAKPILPGELAPAGRKEG